MASKLRGLWVWAPTQLSWWIAVLFMIGAAHFALGCVLYLTAFSHELIMDAVFFIGSIFFTSAAYCQLHQSIPSINIVKSWRQLMRQSLVWQPHHIAFLSAFSQFMGTLMFNMNTFDAFFNLSWFAQDVLVWTPNILGSLLFQLSGCLAVYEIFGRWWCWPSFSRRQGIHWWITFINLMGCVAFLISALLAFAMPNPISSLMATWSTIFTLLGACCFFVGAYLMWPEMATNAEKSLTKG